MTTLIKRRHILKAALGIPFALAGNPLNSLHNKPSRISQACRLVSEQVLYDELSSLDEEIRDAELSIQRIPTLSGNYWSNPKHKASELKVIRRNLVALKRTRSEAAIKGPDRWVRETIDANEETLETYFWDSLWGDHSHFSDDVRELIYT